MGNFFSRRAICGKTKSFPGRIIRWIEFNIFSNYNCQGRSDWKSKKRSKRPTRPQMSCFLPKISVKQWRSAKFQKGLIISTLFDHLFIRQNYFKADRETRKFLRGSGGMLPRKIFENLLAVKAILVLYK